METEHRGSRWILNATASTDILLTAGLIVFLLVLPFQLVVKKLIPGPIGTYWKEGLLAILVALWLLRSILRRKRIRMGTHIEGAVLIYVGLIVARLLIDQSGLVGLWGFYISIMYLPLFWLVPAVIKNQRSWVRYLFILLTGVGAVLALGGLLEFLLNMPLWPSEEILQRQGFADVFIYGTHLRRVYFVLDSPTALANILAILLPLAFVLSMITENKWGRLMALIASILMIACIVLTFSRGIWVAATIALIFMGFLGGYIQKYRLVIRTVLGILVIGGLVWGSVMLLRNPANPPGLEGVRELTPREYQEIELIKIQENLIENEPETGEYEVQTWTLYDAINRQEDSRTVVYMHPSETEKIELIYQVEVPENGALRFGIALSPEVWSPEKGDGVVFSIYVTTQSTPDEGDFVFIRYINPKTNPNDRHWRNFLVDLTPWANRQVNLHLVTEAGPNDNWNYDWAGWSNLEIVSLPEDVVINTKTQNPVVAHTISILDWVRDETNRDRLSAWSLSLKAWQSSPIWGVGLGKTGVAALRTNPEEAFVTESQVLKALTEHGLLGLLVWAYLWFVIGRTGVRAYRMESNFRKRMMITGLLTSLLVVFISGLVYQNLEVKQVNAYFWTLAGTLTLFAGDLDA